MVVGSIIVAVLCFVSLLAFALAKDRGLYSSFPTDLIVSVAVIGLLFTLVPVPVIIGSRMSDRAAVVRYNAFRDTINAARARGTNIVENAAVLNTIAEWNQAIASAKYWNEGWLDQAIDDGFANLPPLE